MSAEAIEQARTVVLTPAQRDVLGELSADGADNRTIGRRLNIAEETVKSHVRAILAAFGTNNRTAAAVDLLRGRVTITVATESRRWPSRGPATHMAPAASAVLKATDCCHRLIEELPGTDTVTRSRDRVTCERAS